MKNLSRSASFLRLRFLVFALVGLSSFIPNAARACACGCGVFDVGAGTMMPTDSPSGFSLFLRYSYMDQNQNWEGSSKAPASDNEDKRILTSFYTIGGQYMIDRTWSVMLELPTYSRKLTTTDDGSVFGPEGSVYTGSLTDMGDLQLTALYTGFSQDLSTGLSFGIKLPTGNYTGPTGPLGGAEFDRDTLPGTGSTDLMIGGYHIGGLTADNALAWFVQARYMFAVLTRDEYRPGNELDAAAGLTYKVRARESLTLAPTLQLIGSFRAHDGGANSDDPNSGYRRVYAAPGVELRFKKIRLYADVEFPVYQDTKFAPVGTSDSSGQLVASSLLKAQLAFDF